MLSFKDYQSWSHEQKEAGFGVDDRRVWQWAGEFFQAILREISVLISRVSVAEQFTRLHAREISGLQAQIDMLAEWQRQHHNLSRGGHLRRGAGGNHVSPRDARVEVLVEKAINPPCILTPAREAEFERATKEAFEALDASRRPPDLSGRAAILIDEQDAHDLLNLLDPGSLLDSKSAHTMRIDRAIKSRRAPNMQALRVTLQRMVNDDEA